MERRVAGSFVAAAVALVCFETDYIVHAMTH